MARTFLQENEFHSLLLCVLLSCGTCLCHPFFLPSLPEMLCVACFAVKDRPFRFVEWKICRNFAVDLR